MDDLLERMSVLEEQINELHKNETEEDEESNRDKCIDNQWLILLGIQNIIIEKLEIYDYEIAKNYIELLAISSETMDKITCC